MMLPPPCFTFGKLVLSPNVLWILKLHPFPPNTCIFVSSLLQKAGDHQQTWFFAFFRACVPTRGVFVFFVPSSTHNLIFFSTSLKRILLLGYNKPSSSASTFLLCKLGVFIYFKRLAKMMERNRTLALARALHTGIVTPSKRRVRHMR